MNRKLLAGLIVAVSLIASIGETSPPEPPKMGFVEQIEGVNLPENQRWYTVLVTSKGQATPITSWFDSDPRLAELRSRTEWRHYTSESELFTHHLKPTYGNDYPILVIQDVDGAMRAQLGGTILKSVTSPDELVAALDLAAQTLRPIEDQQLRAKKVGGWIFNRRPGPNVCPGPNCNPDLPPAPIEGQPVAPPETNQASSPPADKKTPLADALISIFGPQVAPWANGFNLGQSAIAAGIVGGAWLWKRRRSRKSAK
ncbi:hypothetical protein AB1L30_17980 [Bremerella sp. JC817]|uniref:hypothetical protein n=1 Tax=Bremerella sp. JC817 TaxID=3231756 RepID=UPI00345A9DDF